MIIKTYWEELVFDPFDLKSAKINKGYMKPVKHYLDFKVEDSMSEQDVLDFIKRKDVNF